MSKSVQVATWRRYSRAEKKRFQERRARRRAEVREQFDAMHDYLNLLLTGRVL